MAASTPVSPPPMTTICSWGKALSLICSTSSRLWKPYTPPACPSPSTGGRLVREPVAIRSLSYPIRIPPEMIISRASASSLVQLIPLYHFTLYLASKSGSAKQIPSLSLIPPR